MDDNLTINNEFDGDNGSERSDMEFSIFEILEDDITVDMTDDIIFDMSDDISDNISDNISDDKMNDIINTIMNQIQNINIKSVGCETFKDCCPSHDINNEHDYSQYE